MKNKISGIYCIENIVNNKKYIGLSTDINSRKQSHFSHLRNNQHVNKHLQFAWNKYGACNFVFYVLEECAVDILDDRERYYIAKYQSDVNDYGYNIESGGCAGKTIPDETREKISMALIGRSLSEEHKNRIGQTLKGREFSTESLEKMRQAKIGKMSGENHPRSKPIYCPEFNQTFWGAAEVENLYGIDRTYIYACLSGRQKSAGKHPDTGHPLHWVYASTLQTTQN